MFLGVFAFGIGPARSLFIVSLLFFCRWDDRWCRDWIPSSTVLSISNPKRTTFRGLIQLTPSATTIVDVLEGVCDASESLKAALAFVEGCDVLEEDGEDVV
ncbi:uncharacterized protein EV422DRAFT_544870 [Fimicolochytrium jonesii]|uniref:uncharacterized protein n=1 Tax=Fimicolochytrium jonesii TaxID=1396493 RepID=UPI0022FE371F|nr:uncharacterized protein EV422DRAFT_544870 [Fimicolochytrium jonesii]KAI8816594.1 hypothetical protein EV422DRAFT_544870 [Fimicolochytrium jonesii]